MATCPVYDLEALERAAAKILDATNTFDGKSTQIVSLAYALNLNVFNATFADPEIAGLLKIEKGAYNIYVNKRQPVSRQRFTIAHEIAHYILHKNLIDEQSGSILYRKDFGSSSIIEKQANSLAAALLMPKKQVLRAWENLQNIQELANIFETSNEAMYVRLNILGALNG